MRQALETWQNARGETVVRHAAGLAVLARGQTVTQWEAQHRPAPAEEIAAMQRDVEAMTATLVVPLEAQVRHALKDAPGIVAAVDAERGTVRAVVVPKPYYALAAEQVEQLQAEAATLRAEIERPATGWAQRTRLSARLRDIETRLAAAR